MLRAAAAAHREGKLADAERGYDAILRVDSGRVEALAGRAMLMLQTSRVEESLEFFARAMAADAHGLGVRINYASALRRSGRLDEAIDLLITGLATHPNEPAVHGALGVAMRARGDVVAAIEHLEHADRLSGASFEYAGNLGLALFDAGQLERAVTTLARATELAELRHRSGSEVADVHNTLGRAQLRLNDAAAARSSFARATEHDASFTQAWSNLGGALAVLGELDDALVAHRTAERLGRETPGVLDALGVCLRLRGELDASIAAHRAALALDSSSASAHLNLGTALREHGDLAQAERAYRRAIELDPDSALAHFNLAALMQASKNFEEAISSYRESLARDPMQRQAYLALTWILLVAGRGQELDEVFADWLRSIPHDPVAAHMAAARGAADIPLRASAGYVASHFDDFAVAFDSTLERLEYSAPRLVAETVGAALAGQVVSRLLDAGCGTGLCGPLVRSMCNTLEGVDLSAGMMEIASRRNCYDRLVCADLSEFLDEEPGAYDVVIAADVLIYFGDLDGVVVSLARSLRGGGLLAFTIECHDDDAPYRLLPSGRYSQSRAHVMSALSSARIQVLEIEDVVLRLELGIPVAGCLVLGARV